MKQLILSLAILFAITVSGTASAEVRFERRSGVKEVYIKNTAKNAGWSQVFTFTRAAKTVIKNCVRKPSHDCLYEVDAKGRERELFRYKAHDLMMVLYTTETTGAVR